MPLGGRRLSIEEALALCRKAGFTNKNIVTAVALMCAESGRYTEAYNINAPTDGNPSIDRGLFQINSLHTNLGMADSFTARRNARYAFKLSQSGTDFSPWMAFVNKAHEQFIPDVQAVFDADDWRQLVPTIWEELG